MKRNGQGLALLIGALLLVTTAAGANQWKHKQTVRIGETGPTRVKLPLETLGAAQADLDDVRLMNPDGQIVPFYLTKSTQAEYSYRSVSTYDTSESDTRTWIQLVTGTARSIDALKVRFQESRYFKTATLKAADTPGEWTTLKRNVPLFASSRGPTNRIIQFDPGSWRYLALELDNTQSSPVTLSSAKVRIPPETTMETTTVPLDFTVHRRTEKSTLYKVDLPGKNLPLHALFFEVSDPVFRRRLSIFSRHQEKGVHQKKHFARGTVYKISSDDVVDDRQNTTLRVNQTIPVETLYLRIQEGDNPRLDIDGIKAVNRTVSVVFWANSTGQYQLLTGNPEARQPNYDLANLEQYTRQSELPTVKPGPLETNDAYRAPESLPELPTVGAKLDPSQWSYRLEVPIKEPGIKWMELPPAVLSGTRGNLNDVRLSNGNRQVPYVIDDTVLQRKLDTGVYTWNQTNNSGKRVSRITINLPYSNLPLSRLTARIDESLFDRTVRLYRRTPDQRNQSRELLRRTTWRRTPDSNRKTVQLDFRGRPKAKELVLEIDNGTNAPLTVSDLSVFYRTRRLFFKTNASEPLDLLYGREDAPRPDYDLSLVAYDLITSKAKKVSTKDKPVVQTDESTDWGFPATVASKKLIFWTVMILVVLALLYVIARLLPEPAE